MSDPAVQALLDSANEEPYGILNGLDLPLSPELTRLLERGLIGPGSSAHPHAKKAARAFQKTFEEMGGVERLTAWADKNPTRFYTLYSKLVPATAEIHEKRDINVTISWASADRLSYQTKPPAEVIDVDPS